MKLILRILIFLEVELVFINSKEKKIILFMMQCAILNKMKIILHYYLFVQ